MADKDRIQQALLRAARGGGVSCKTLLGLARRLGVGPRRLGRLCNQKRIHIRACQLGCFK